MNASRVSLERAGHALHHLVRRFPLATRALELVLVIALYAGGLWLVDSLSGHANWLVAVYAIFAMPVVLSVGLRLFRSLERRVAHLRGEHPFGQTG